jgi:hypothetical protein
MTKSPTVQQALKQFSILSDTINKSGHKSNLIYLIYPIVILFLLLIIKPTFILKTDYTSHEKTISFHKLIAWFMIFYAPVIAYYVS